MSDPLTTKERISLIKKAVKGLNNSALWDLLSEAIPMDIQDDDMSGQYIVYTGTYREGCGVDEDGNEFNEND